MNIEELLNRMAGTEINKTTRTERGTAGGRHGTGNGENVDRVDMSHLTSLLRSSSGQLADIHSIRPEKVAEFKQQLINISATTDNVVNTIFTRMIS